MESVLRVLAMYGVLLLVFRLGGKRTLSQASTFDFLLLLILSETTQQAMVGDDQSLTQAFLLIVTFVLINIVLAVFNALPLPPLDGGRVAVGLLPEPASSILARAEPFGFLILILLLMTHALDKIIGPPIEFLINFYFKLL